MLFVEEYARVLLVVHTVLAAALVGAATHLVIWMWRWWRGRYDRHRAIRRFAVITAALFVATFLVGNAIYPVYKVRVKAQYLEEPAAVAQDIEARDAAAARVVKRHVVHLRGEGREVVPVLEEPVPSAARDAEAPARTVRIGRWFDVKEHWVALGMILSLGLCGLLYLWNPRKGGAGIAPIAVLMAIGAAGSVWLGAIIGIVVASYRAIGPL